MDFVSVSAAKKMLNEHAFRGEVVQLPLLDSIGHYAAAGIKAPMDIPGFDNAAMDGFCFRYSDYEKQIPLHIRYTIQAGETTLPNLQGGEAAKIFTGAPIPIGADTVVMQEKTYVEDERLYFIDNDFIAGANIRLRASQTSSGEVILSENTLINAGLIGFLAGFGIQSVYVYKAPRIGICCTGKELIAPGQPLQFGQIYESNSISLQALLAEMNIAPLMIKTVDDDLNSIRTAIQDMLDYTDILIITGGISVGAYDYVHEALQLNGIDKLFYKVKQKPGKPMFFGKIDRKRVFALPGNPAATFTCFHQYVKPFLQFVLGQKNMYDATKTGFLNTSYLKKGSLTQFLKAHEVSGKINILDGQESYKMNAFSLANCLIELSEDKQLFDEKNPIPFISI
jgi:molybdopterin molybdotransferase